jgi:hypothetical protein
MASWIVVVPPAAPASSHYRTVFSGQVVDDANIPVAALVAQGALLWPTTIGATDPVATAAAKIFASRRAKGRDPVDAASAMLAAVAQGTNANTEGWSGANLFAAVQKATATIGFAQLTTAGATQTLVLPSLMLPANARILARELNVTAAFTGPGLTGMTVSVGGAAGSNDIVNGQSVFTLLGLIAGTSGTNPQPLYSAATQVNVLFTATGANVNAATAGSVTIDLLIALLP